MDKLQFIQEWDKLLVKIADIMNTSVETIQSNAGEYLLKFAKYQLISDIGRCIGASICIGILILLIKIGIDYECNKDIKALKYFKIFFILTIIVFVLVFGTEVIKYLASPEIYGIKELLRLIN